MQSNGSRGLLSKNWMENLHNGFKVDLRSEGKSHKTGVRGDVTRGRPEVADVMQEAVGRATF